MDQTDAIFVLAYLFNADTTPPCIQSADTNGDGGLSLSDGVYLLRYLFAGGTPPLAPFEECGPPGAGELSCDAFPACEG